MSESDGRGRGTPTPKPSPTETITVAQRGQCDMSSVGNWMESSCAMEQWFALQIEEKRFNDGIVEYELAETKKPTEVLFVFET